MQALQTFFRTLINSAISPAYYNDVVRAPASFSWKYFLAFNFLAALLFGVVVGIPLALLNVSGLIEQTATVYPSDLEITGDQQGLSINQELPYSIPLPMTWEENMDQQTESEEDVNIPANLVTFVSEEEATEGARIVSVHDSFAVITPNTVYVREDEDGSEIRAYPMPQFDQPFTIDRQLVNDWVNKIADNPFFKQRLYAPLIAVFIVLFSYPFILIWKTVTLAFYSLIVWAITSITMKDKQLGFGKIFQIGQHSMTLITILAVIVNIVTLFTLGGVFFMIAFVVWTLYLIAQLRGRVATMAMTESKPTRSRATRTTRSKTKRSRRSK